MYNGEGLESEVYEGRPIDLTGKHILFPKIIGDAIRKENRIVKPIIKFGQMTGFSKSQEMLFEIIKYYNYDGDLKYHELFSSDIIYYDDYKWHVLDFQPEDIIIHCGNEFSWPPENVCANLGMSDFEFLINIAMTHSAATFNVI